MTTCTFPARIGGRVGYLTAADPAVASVTIETTITAADTSARTITGRIMTYGETGNTNLGPTRFLPGSIQAGADPSRIKLLIDHKPDQIVGYGKSVDDRGADGLWATFQVAPGPIGDDVLAQAAGKLRDGLSVGVQVVTSVRAADGAIEVSAGVWRETSVVGIPAFASANVQQVAAAQQAAAQAAGYPFGGFMPAPVQQAPAPYYAPAQFAQTAPAGQSARLSLAEVTDRLSASYQTEGVEGAQKYLQAALADIVPPTTDAAGREAWFPSTWLGELWTASKIERPLIDAISGPLGLTSLRVKGFRKVRPFGRGDMKYAGNKTAIPSGGNFTLAEDEETAQRFAMGHDVDRAFVDFGAGEFIRAYFQAQTDNYLENTEAWAAAKLFAEATLLQNNPKTLIDALIEAAVQLSTIGARITTVKIAPNLFRQALAINTANSPWLLTGSANLVDGTANIGGLSMTVEPTFADFQFVALDRRAATYREWKNPPLKVQVENVPQGGVDLAVFGYASCFVEDSRAVVAGLVDNV